MGNDAGFWGILKGFLAGAIVAAAIAALVASGNFWAILISAVITGAVVGGLNSDAYKRGVNYAPPEWGAVDVR
jgi:hypothetical protein